MSCLFGFGPSGYRPGPRSFLLAFGLLALVSCGEVRRPAQLSTALSLAEHGRFEDAEATLRELRHRASSPAIAKMLEITRSHVARYREAYARADRELKAQLRERTRAQVLRFARDRARAADRNDDAYLARAFEIRMSQLDELAADVERVGHRQPPAKETREKSQSRVDAGATEDEVLGASIEHFLQDIDALVKRGDFKQATARLREMLPMDPKAGGRLRQRLWKLNEVAKGEIASILKQAEVLELGGEGRKALRFLRKESRAFPAVGSLAGVHEAIRALEQRLNAPAGKTPPSFARAVEEARRDSGSAETPDTDSGFNRRVRRELAKEADEAFSRREYAKAARTYGKAAELAKGLHFEQRYRALSAEAELMILAFDALRDAINRHPSSFRGVAIGYGEKADILSAEEGGLRVRIGKEEELVPYHGIPDASLAPLLARAAESPRELVGAAVLLHRALNHDAAVALLKKAVSADAAIKPVVDQVLAGIRGEHPGKGGYVLVGGKFVSTTAKARTDHARRLSGIFAAIYAKSSDSERDKAYEKILADDGQALEIAIEEFAEKKNAIYRNVSKNPAVKSLEKLRYLRVELDKRRTFAKDLIFDTVRYFYPYKPPAVSGEKAAEYARVQLEVDKRVAAVRQIWEGKRKVKVTLPAKVVRDLGLYRWMTGKLERLGANTDDLDRTFQVLFARPEMNVRSYAFDRADREFVDRSERIVAENAVMFSQLLAKKAINRAEAELIRLTNEYRHMMGQIPLRCDERLVRSAHGHCQEMSELGYFSHTSPTPGRERPAQRMRNEGYPRGGGENLAIHASPAGAIYAWQHSSGHHRNMLMGSHRDLGTGNVGRYWAQNFGAGEIRQRPQRLRR